MNVYFACSLTGGRNEEKTYGRIVDHLLAAEHDVPTAHLARPEVMQLEQVVDAVEVYERDVAWIRRCDAMVAEVTTPSHGVGYEIAFALNLGKPVLACHQQGTTVSKMITGNRSRGLRVAAYRNDEEALRLIDRFLSEVAEGT